MNTNPGLLLSVIVPTCGRNELLARCLERLAPEQQQFPASRYEVLVSDDSLSSSARMMVTSQFPWARWLQGPRRGPAANRNHGAKFAQGEWLAFVDDDCVPSIEWLAGISEHSAGTADVIEGKTVCPNRRDTPFEEHIENLSGGVYWSCNLAVRRSVFGDLGGFDEDFLQPCCEDMEFAWRAKHRGLQCVFAEKALVEHPTRSISFRALWKRTLMARWHCLYELKTREGARTQSSILAVPRQVVRQTLNLLRTSWHALVRPSDGARKKALFFLVWNLVTFPVVLPYCCYWDIRFRRSLRNHLQLVERKTPALLRTA